jgi:hypothetical protein
MSATHPSGPSDDESPLGPTGKTMPIPADLPVEPDLGPVPPLAHPEDPGAVPPAI